MAGAGSGVSITRPQGLNGVPGRLARMLFDHDY